MKKPRFEAGQKTEVRHVRVPADEAGRRVDNYLTGLLNEIPKSRIYRMLRKGEVRINGRRVRQDYRLHEGDIIRVPPLFRGRGIEECTPAQHPPARLQALLDDCILYEDDNLLVMNKPAGIAVHAGSGERYGVIEIMRALRPDCSALELVHRLDKLTSGCLMLAKNHRYLRELHGMLRRHQVQKHYTALLYGTVPRQLEITLPLAKNALLSGERMVKVGMDGKTAKTVFFTEKYFRDASLVQAVISTGRTHQIRVHAAHCGHPVAGDPKYGDRDFNRRLRRSGLHRMFLHAHSLTLTHNGKTTTINGPLPEDLRVFLARYAQAD